MKQSIQFSALLLILLIFSSKIPASFLPTKQGEVEVKHKELSGEVSIQEMEESESMDVQQLLGMEEIEEGDDDDGEWSKRRIIAEAHLDYIYTQHHNP